MKKRVRELVGFVLLAAGIGGVFVGVHAVSGGESAMGGPAIGAGAVANVLAYRVLRTTTTRTEGRPTYERSREGDGPEA